MGPIISKGNKPVKPVPVPEQNVYVAQDPVSPPSNEAHSGYGSTSGTESPTTGCAPPDGSPVQKLLKGLFDYDKLTDGDVEFKQGDLMLLLDDSDDAWWYVMVSDTGKKGYVPRDYVARHPSVESEQWYHGPIPRVLATIRVTERGLPRGTFLIRESERSRGQLALTLRDNDPEQGCRAWHYIIKQSDNGGFFIAKTIFPSLQELVKYYRNDRDRGLRCKLTLPCPREDIPNTRGVEHINKNKLEIPREEIDKRHRIDGGNFGDVYYGKWRKFVDVAIKELKPNTMSPEAFLGEAHIMKRFTHPHLVRMYGICSADEPVSIITEFMPNKSLLSFLHNRREDGNLVPFLTMIKIIAQIASGMAYLEEQKLAHRDLAARNVLVGKNRDGATAPTVKLADFGLARFIIDADYIAKKDSKFPIKWTAPEAVLGDMIFSLKSDVWSFGILLFEIMTHGKAPYAGMTTVEVIEFLSAGKRMKQPKECPDTVYEVMTQCWNEKPERRPTFEYLCHYYFQACQPLK